MKKLAAAVCCMAALLCGCTTGSSHSAVDSIINSTAVPFAISGSAAIAGVEQPIGMDITRNADSLVVEISSPAQVQGLRLAFDEGMVQVSYRTMIMNLTDGDIPELSVFAALRDGLSALPPTAEQVTRAGDELVASLNGKTPCRLVWNSDGSRLLRVELPAADVVISVDSFENQQ